MIDFKFSQFFDKPGVLAKIDAGARAAMARAGAFIRRSARSSIRKRRRVADAGGPPSGHTGRLRELIFFAYDFPSRSVVVGPLLFKKRRGSKTVPELLETGGDTITDAGKPATYRAFPYMKPALDANAPQFPELFTDCVK